LGLPCPLALVLLAGLPLLAGVLLLALAVWAIAVHGHVLERILGHGSPPVKGYMAIIIAQN